MKGDLVWKKKCMEKCWLYDDCLYFLFEKNVKRDGYNICTLYRGNKVMVVMEGTDKNKHCYERLNEEGSDLFANAVTFLVVCFICCIGYACKRYWKKRLEKEGKDFGSYFRM